jgi:hypothetical protein
MDRNAPAHRLTVGTLVRAAIAELPGGGIVATAWNEWDTNTRFQRVFEMLNEMYRVIEELRATGAVLQPGEAEMQLLEEAVTRVQMEHREAKRLQLGRAAANCIIRTNAPFEERRSFLRAADELDPTHIQILNFLQERNARDPIASVTYKEIGTAVFHDIAHLPNQGHLGDAVLTPALNVLAGSYGFIERGWPEGGGMLHTSHLSPEGIARGCRHQITAIGLRFLDFLQAPAHA